MAVAFYGQPISPTSHSLDKEFEGIDVALIVALRERVFNWTRLRCARSVEDNARGLLIL